MIKKLTLFLTVLIATWGTAHAQFCATEDIRQSRLATEPGFAGAVQQKQQDWSQFLQNPLNSLIFNTSQGPVYEIPVVIHVMHVGGAVGSMYNPSTTQLNNMINYLNASYATTWAGYPDSNNGGTRIPIRFALAKRTPDCQPTDGIVRYDASGLAGYTADGVKSSGVNPGVNDVDLKNLSRWPRDQYYNIWVVNKINGNNGTSGSFVAGFAYTVPAPANVDGCVMLATQANVNKITLVHEIGHSFDLLHTFQGGNTVCPPNTNCNTDGDEICDTEPHIIPNNFACQTTGTNPCTTQPWGTVAYNFMNYTNCQNRFTAGQRTRVMFTLLNYRQTLINSLGATPLATTPVPIASCVPTTNPATNTNSSAGPRAIQIADMYGNSGSFTQDGNNVYLDKACQGIAHLDLGQPFPVSVKTGFNTERVRIYIDYNNNGLFTDANELVYSNDGTLNNETHTGTPVVPTTGVVTCTPLRVRIVTDRSIAPVPGPCSQLNYGQAEDYSAIVAGPSNSATVGIAITNGGNPSCFGTPITLTATPVGTATNTSYKWFVNGILNPTTTATFTSTNFANGDVVYARLFYTGPCGSDSTTSNNVTITRSISVAPIVTMAVTAGSNPGCQGQSITFTATPTNGGTAPMYDFQVSTGGPFVSVQSGLGATYSTTTLNAGDQIRVVMTSNSPCALPATATSTTETISFGTSTATASIAITAGSNPSCPNKPITFTATITNGGNNPQQIWTVNGQPVGVTGPTFTTTTLQNNDLVGFRLVSNNPCVNNPVVVTAFIPVTILPADTISVNVIIVEGENPGCKDSLLTFEAVPVNFGSNVTIYWLLNASVASVGNTFSGTTTFQNGDVIVAMAVENGPGCRTNDTVYSTPIQLIRNLPIPAPFISWVGGSLVSNIANVQWYGPMGVIAGATGTTYTPTTPGTFYAIALSPTCNSLPSNKLFTQNVSVGNYNLGAVKIYPNPTNSLLKLDWTTQQSKVRLSLQSVTGQTLLTKTVQNVQHASLNLDAFANGIYFLLLQDDAGNTANVKVTVSH